MLWLLRPCSVRSSKSLRVSRRGLMSSPSSQAIVGKHDVHDAETGSPQRPEQAHINTHVHSRTHKKRKSIENELSEAMQSSLMPITTSSGGRSTSTSTSERTDNPFLYGTASTLTRPVNLALAPERGRSSNRIHLQRQRSLSAGSLNEPGDGDPFAWLRQTVQEQRRQASLSEHTFIPSTSMPTSPISTAHLATSPTSIRDTSAADTNDYIGTGWLSLVAGKGPVSEHLHGQAPPVPSSSTTSRFAFPSMPNLPSMPTFQTPTMPSFKAPNLANFSTSSASSFMPDSLARIMGGNMSENENKKFMDEDDQTASDEPDWARIKDKYEKPQLPMVFLHGLFGFSVLGPSTLPAFQIQYWRGVRQALEELGVEVLMTASPASGNIETRAKAICEQIIERFPGREVNLIGHSMGGLDARYLITHLQPEAFTVKTLTTIATPHRGSAFADYLLEDILGRRNLPSLLTMMDALQMPGGGRAFDALTRTKMARFNEETPDDPSVTYYSYGAKFKPSIVDVFRLPWSIIYEKEGDNDGLVSVESAMWGNYKATLDNVNHLDLVGWVGRMRFAFAELTGKAIRFKPVSFYLAIAEELAKEGY